MNMNARDIYELILQLSSRYISASDVLGQVFMLTDVEKETLKLKESVARRDQCHLTVHILSSFISAALDKRPLTEFILLLLRCMGQTMPATKEVRLASFIFMDSVIWLTHDCLMSGDRSKQSWAIQLLSERLVYESCRSKLVTSSNGCKMLYQIYEQLLIISNNPCKTSLTIPSTLFAMAQKDIENKKLDHSHSQLWKNNFIREIDNITTQYLCSPSKLPHEAATVLIPFIKSDKTKDEEIQKALQLRFAILHSLQPTLFFPLLLELGVTTMDMDYIMNYTGSIDMTGLKQFVKDLGEGKLHLFKDKDKKRNNDMLICNDMKRVHSCYLRYGVPVLTCSESKKNESFCVVNSLLFPYQLHHFAESINTATNLEEYWTTWLWCVFPQQGSSKLISTRELQNGLTSNNIHKMHHFSLSMNSIQTLNLFILYNMASNDKLFNIKHEFLFTRVLLSIFSICCCFLKPPPSLKAVFRACVVHSSTTSLYREQTAIILALEYMQGHSGGCKWVTPIVELLSERIINIM